MLGGRRAHTLGEIKMAKINILIEDIHDGMVDVKFNFDPPVKDIDPEDQTRAQMLTAEVLNFLSTLGAEQMEKDGK